MIFFVIAILIVTMWVMFKFRGFQQKFLTVFLIVLILFSFFSFYLAFNGKNITIKSVSDVEKLGKLYFSWLGNVFNNIKILTTQAIKMRWEGNRTIKSIRLT